MSDYSASHTAVAACRQLGYSGMLEVSFRFGEGDDASFDIDCTSNDESLRSCALSNATCNEHIFVSCRSGRVQPFELRLGRSSVF